jgi:hypothetical protein
MSYVISSDGTSGSSIAQTLATANNTVDSRSNADSALTIRSSQVGLAQTTSVALAAAEAVTETVNQALLTDALNAVAETLTDVIKDLAEGIKRIIDERDQANQINFDYYTGRSTLDAFSNVVHAAYRRKPDKRRRS